MSHRNGGVMYVPPNDLVPLLKEHPLSELAAIGWPVLDRFRLGGGLAISPHGIGIAIGFLVGAWLLALCHAVREDRSRENLPVDHVASPVMRAALIAALTLVTLAASCTSEARRASPSASSSTGTESPSGEPTPSAQPVTNYASFTHAFDAAGFTVREGERTGLLRLLAIPAGQQVFIDGVPVSVFEYPTEKALDEVRSSVSPQGDQIPTADGRGTVLISWEPPHFYGAGKLLVLYFGDKQRTLDALDLLLGPQFAGG